MINTIFLISIAIYLASSIVHNFMFLRQIQNIEEMNKLKNIVSSINFITLILLMMDIYLLINR